MNSYARQQNAAFRHLARDMAAAAPDPRIADLEAKITRLQYRLEVARERIAQLESQQNGSSSPLSTQEGSVYAPRGGAGGGDTHPSSLIPSSHWLTTAEFAARHNVSQSTLSRALNGLSGNQVVGPLLHLPNGHWLIADSAAFVRQRKRRA